MKTLKKSRTKYGSYTIPGTEFEKSALYVPLVVGDQAKGLINLLDLDKENAFSDFGPAPANHNCKFHERRA